MATTKKLKSAGYKLLGIDLLEFSLANSDIGIKEEILSYTTQINLEHKINEQGRLIIVVPSVKILHEDNVTLLATVKASFLFEFETFKGFKSDKPNSFDFPEDLIITLNSLSISTLRGIMFTLFRGTFLHKSILPLLDPRDFTLEAPND